MKRAIRRQRTQNVVNRQKKVLARTGIIKNMSDTDIQRRVGSCKKKKALDCGHARCLVCHCDKIHNISTPQQLKAEISFREQISEISRETIH